MFKHLLEDIRSELGQLRDQGLYKEERIITTPQGSEIDTTQKKDVLNFCANNYLGLAAHPELREAARETITKRGFGLSSVRFICGTQDIHKELEGKTAEFLGMEDAILYAAAFDANGGLFEPLLSKEDAIISDELNHASIIDGIRLCKAARYRFKHNDMDDLRSQLQLARDDGNRRIMIATDGVFSMDGTIAQLGKICDLAEEFKAIVMIDDCHATGFMGANGRGTHEFRGVMGRVDIITGTYGKALGGASGGFTAGPQEVVNLLRQKSRPYLFSNTVAPSIVGASIQALNMLSESTELRDRLERNTIYFRDEIKKAGFDILPGKHPIVPIMVYDAELSQRMSESLLKKGIYVIGFFYPVVPKGKARIRVQLSAAHEKDHLKKAIEAFTESGKELGIID